MCPQRLFGAPNTLICRDSTWRKAHGKKRRGSCREFFLLAKIDGKGMDCKFERLNIPPWSCDGDIDLIQVVEYVMKPHLKLLRILSIILETHHVDWSPRIGFRICVVCSNDRLKASRWVGFPTRNAKWFTSLMLLSTKKFNDPWILLKFTSIPKLPSPSICQRTRIYFRELLH